MEEVLFSIDAGVARITINRPSKGNSLSPDVLKELRRILHTAEPDSNVRVITISGAGDRTFCAGLDLKASQGPEKRPPALSEFRQLLVEIVQCPKPVVTIARGHVIGGGFGIVLASDLSVACKDIHFSTPEIHVGMFPMMVFGLLHRNIGRKKAIELMMLGERITAAQAQEFGIINHAYSREIFDAAAGEFVRKIAAKSSVILQMGKEVITGILDKDLGSEEKLLESALADVMATGDSKEGIRAFVEKRAPRWTDK